MAKGQIETLKNGFRAKVYLGIDPISKKEIRLNGPVRPEYEDAVADQAKLLQEAKSKRPRTVRQQSHICWTSGWRSQTTS